MLWRDMARYGEMKRKYKLNKVSDATAKRDLKKLVDKGVLKSRGNGPETYYILSRYEPMVRGEQGN